MREREERAKGSVYYLLSTTCFVPCIFLSFLFRAPIKEATTKEHSTELEREKKTLAHSKQQREKRPLVSGLLFHNSSCVCVSLFQAILHAVHTTHTVCRRVFSP